jgi:hypothetical protein
VRRKASFVVLIVVASSFHGAVRVNRGLALELEGPPGSKIKSTSR